MKLARYIDGEKEHYGVIEGDRVFEVLSGHPIFLGLESITKATKGTELSKVKLLSPVEPSKIVAIGLNYKAHAAEFDKALPTEPMIFLKPASSVIGPESEIIYPDHMSHRVDFEGELGVVIGKRAKDVAVEDAKEYILGYTCVNDVTARDLQGKDIQFTRAKGFDTFAPVGPWIETELDTSDIMIESYLNGEKRQSTSTKDMIFNVGEILSFVSHVMTLEAGDVIATGTPSGLTLDIGKTIVRR